MKIAPIIAATTTTSTIESRIVTSLNRLRMARVRSDLGDSVSRGYGPPEAHPATVAAITKSAAIERARVNSMVRGFITCLQAVGYRDVRQLLQTGYRTVYKSAEESGSHTELNPSQRQGVGEQR